jgi:hypothetical protein
MIKSRFLLDTQSWDLEGEEIEGVRIPPQRERNNGGTSEYKGQKENCSTCR